MSLLRPVLQAQRIDFPDGSHRHDVWCPWCERVHHHGETAGGLGAQCANGDGNSPLAGYSPQVASRRDYREQAAFPEIPMAGISRFHRSVEISADALRRALFSTMFLKRPCSIMTRSLVKQQISFTVADFGQFSIRFPDGRVMFGDEFLSLISELYGIPRGVAAVRILEATTNARFDATAALEIAAAVDRWVDRGAPKNEERRT